MLVYSKSGSLNETRFLLISTGGIHYLKLGHDRNICVPKLQSCFNLCKKD